MKLTKKQINTIKNKMKKRLDNAIKIIKPGWFQKIIDNDSEIEIIYTLERIEIIKWKIGGKNEKNYLY